MLSHYRLHLLSSALVLTCLLAGAVPMARADAPTHVVQPGETLSQIATAAGVSVDTLVTLNNLPNADSIVAAQVIQLPAGAATPTAAPAATSVPAAPPASSPATTYTVQPGDVLWQIAAKYGVSGDALVQANSLDDPDHLVAGTQLIIPDGTAGSASAPPASTTAVPAATPAPSAPPTPAATSAPASAPPSPGSSTLYTSYTVQPGESLFQIAQKFNTSVANLAQLNNLSDPNVVAAGTVLKVPVPARQYVVQSGDTLSSIAGQQKVDLGSLEDDNTISDPTHLQVGQVILLPAGAGGGVQQAASLPPSTPSPTPTPTQAATATPAPSPDPTTPPTPSPSPATPTPSPAPTKTASPPPSPTAARTPTVLAGAPPVRPAATLPPGAPTGGLAGSALRYVGDPYVWGGASPAGFDCSGLVWYVFQQTGRTVPRSLFGQYNLSSNHPSAQSLQVGDLVFFQDTYTAGLSHNGIYVGNGLFVHAANEDWGVTISNVADDYWTAHWFGATRP